MRHPKRDRLEGDGVRHRGGRSRGGTASVSALLVVSVSLAIAAAHVASENSVAGPAPAVQSEAMGWSGTPEVAEVVVRTYCVACHNQALNTAGLALDQFDVTNPTAEPEVWERVIRKLRTRTMPPAGAPRPDESGYEGAASWLEEELDRAWAANPNPGRISAVHRLNRTEYNNAVRDLLALDVNVRGQLPGDETADGSFDNFAASLSFTTAHLERYMSVARQVTRLAVGLTPDNPALETFEVPLHIWQDDRRGEDLPFGSRGGVAIPYHFPVEGEYRIRVRLQRQYQNYIRGMGWPQQVEVRLDGELLERFTVGGEAEGRPSASSYSGHGQPGGLGDPEWEAYMHTADDLLEVRVHVAEGPRTVTASFVRDVWEPEGFPQPAQRGRALSNDNRYMEYQAVGEVQIGGPYEATGPARDTPSRREIFVCYPEAEAEEVGCASEILERMARRAYRRPATEAEVEDLLRFFDEGRAEGGSFDHGIQFALERLLVDPDFLVRVYRDPPEAAVSAGEAYPLSDLEVATRLSFFLWSSIPDETLLDLAEREELTNPEVLEGQVRRMLADPRAIDALVGDFTAQWLNLRLLDEVEPDHGLYGDFDDNLLEAFERETEMFVASTIREDRSIPELLAADYTYANERLARHYGIPNVYGSRFRRVSLPNPEQRGGLLAHGGLLAISSYPDRTSPVLRGKWLLDNILGAPPAPPPPNVDTTLDEEPGQEAGSIRERLAQHRNDPTCASCHSIIDPLGFALEEFDVVGRVRTVDERGQPVDNMGVWPSGEEMNGVAGLRAMLLEREEQFVATVTEKLMAYALGRGLAYYDQPAVREIVRNAAAEEYRWSAIVLGIVQSPPFLTRLPDIEADD